MENYELFIPIIPKRKNGCFTKGSIPFNKGIPMKQWMDGRKIKKVLKYLEIGRRIGNEKYLAGQNRKMIVAIKDGKLIAFKSASVAGPILKARGIKVSVRNISKVCSGTTENNNGTIYFRKKAGGYRWFFAEDTEKYKDLIY